MKITNKDIQGKSPKDIHILFLSEEERKKANIQTDLPSFTIDDIRSFQASLSLPRLLLLAAKRSLGKTEYDLEKQSEELKQINAWINQIQQRISLAQEVKQEQRDSKEEVNMNMQGGSKESNKFRASLKEMCQWADRNGITIDIDRDTSGPNLRVSLKPDPSDYIEQLQRISGTLNAEIKNITTKVQKSQSDSNTFTEMMSAVVKKFNDLILGILQKTQ